MPQSDRAAIFVQRGGPPAKKQIEPCSVHCFAVRYPIIAVIARGEPRSAVALVLEGRVNVIVTGYDSRTAQQIAADIDGHGRVEVIRPEPHVLEPPQRKLAAWGDLIRRWWRSGKSVKEISALVDADTTDVRAILRKYEGGPGRSR